MYETVVWFISFFLVISESNAVSVNENKSLSANISDNSGSDDHLPAVGHQNISRHINITSNELNPETTPTITTVIKTLKTDHSRTHTIADMLDLYEGSKGNSSSKTTVSTPLRTSKSIIQHVTHVANYTTVSPSHSVIRHHFNMKILDYILIPVGCLLAIVISYFLVRHVQKVRRKRRLERELCHQYSYPNSEADDMEEHNIGEIESVVNAQFVSFTDRSDKNLYEDSSEINLAFDESSKLVVQEPPPVPSEESEASTSFTS